MKELSIEEKAKRYDEALEKAKNYHSPVTVCNVRIAMENLFPELAESEDERIRQFLIHEVTETSDKIMSYRNINKKDVLAWLEKQGKKKPAWSDEDEEIIKNIFSVLDVQVCWDGATGKKGNPYQKEIDWLKSIKDRVQPKQEWSEEDEEMYKEVLTDIMYTKNSLKAKGCFGLSKSAMMAFNWFSKRYKSLRPQSQWKPSEEQIDMLKIAMSTSNSIVLDSLYNDLKKLREE